MVLVGLVIVALTSIWPGTVGAQEGEGEGLRSTLTYQDAEGERVPAEGVTVIVTDNGGAEVARGTSDVDGAVSIDLPGPGTYTVAVDTESLPEGISLRDPAETSRDIEVRADERRNFLFALVGEDGAADDEGSSGDDADDEGSSSLFLGLTFNGLKVGLIIAMCSVGLSLIYGTTGLTNFAHGELVAFGALIALALNIAGLHVIPAAIVAIVASGAFGALNELVLWRPLRNRGTGLIAMLVISIGFSILLRYLYLYQAGGRRQRYDQFSLQTGIDLGPITVVPRELITILITVTVLVLVAIGVKTTKIGKAMRAVADNRDLAESSGIDVSRVILVIWVAGGALAGLGGVLMGLDQGIRWDMGTELLLLMFATVTLGGLGTAYGPLVGGIIIGLFVNVSTMPIGGYGLPPELKNVGALLILGLILLVRPQGLMGQKARVG